MAKRVKSQSSKAGSSNRKVPTTAKAAAGFSCGFCQKAYKVERQLARHEAQLHAPAIPQEELKAFAYYFTVSNAGMPTEHIAGLIRQGKWSSVVGACDSIFCDMAQDAYTVDGYGDGENYSDRAADRLYNDLLKEARTWMKDAKMVYCRLSWAKLKAGLERF